MAGVRGIIMNTLYLSDYIITKDGEVINKHNGHKVKPQPNGKGYLRVSIGKKLMFVHRLVATLYVPNPENKPQVNHKDGNKQNNRADNLEWVTNQENRTHAVNHQLICSGVNAKNSKLTEDDVAFIRTNKDMNITQLANKFNVARSTIRDVLNYKRYKHLKRYAELSLNEMIEVEDKKPLR